MNYFPQIQVPSKHKVIVSNLSPMCTVVQVFVGLSDDQFYRVSGADRMNCREMFSVEKLPDGRYKVKRTVNSDRARKFRGMTAKSDKVDQALQKFIDSL